MVECSVIYALLLVPLVVGHQCRRRIVLVSDEHDFALHVIVLGVRVRANLYHHLMGFGHVGCAMLSALMQ